jgi:hypothetical protein
MDMKTELTDEQVQQFSNAIIPTVYDHICPTCQAAPTVQCLTRKKDGWTQLKAPHMSRIIKASKAFLVELHNAKKETEQQ